MNEDDLAKVQVEVFNDDNDDDLERNNNRTLYSELDSKLYSYRITGCPMP